MPADARPDVHDELMATLKRRGYLQPSYEIYGGVAGFFDYGPLGAALKTNIENLWRRHYVLGEGMAEIQCPTISPEQVFRASGHLEKFADTVIDCPECGAGNRGDHLVRNEWKRILEGAGTTLHKLFPGWKTEELPTLSFIAQHVEQLRDSADRDPSPENLAGILRGSHIGYHNTVHEMSFSEAESPEGEQKLLAAAYWSERNDPDGYRADSSVVMDGRESPLVRAPVLVKGGPAGIHILKASKVVYAGLIQCPACGKPLDVSKARIDAFNLMFKTQVGPGSGRAGYLRPETAQGMFMDFGWLYRFFREKLPFGAVQVGKAYRNEISPRQSLLRLREFHQMEAEVFFDPDAKSWPRYDRLKAKTLQLLPHTAQTGGEEKVTPMPMGEAVEKGVIANGALGYFLALTQEFLENAGIPTDALRFRQHLLTEKAHYSTDTWDAEFLSPRFGWVEIVGIADRTDYDLKAHERVSGQKLRAMRRYAEPKEVEVSRYVPNPTKLGPTFKGKAGAISKALAGLEAPDEAPPQLTVTLEDGEAVTLTSEFYRVEKRRERVEGEWYVPHVVEPSYGVDRIFYAVLETAWAQPSAQKEWASLRLASAVAPVKCGVFPLMSKDGLDDIALALDEELRVNGIASQYDDGGAIGRRYARQDEIGTPWCVTVDYDTKEKGTVTLRERDTGKQKLLARERVLPTLQALVAGRLLFEQVEEAPVVG